MAVTAVFCWLSGEGMIRNAVLLILFFVLVWSLGCEGSRNLGLWGRRSLQWLGETSYSPYMVHALILLLLQRNLPLADLQTQALPLRATAVAGCLAAIFLATGLVYRFIEEPGRRLSRCRPGRSAPGPPACRAGSRRPGRGRPAAAP